MVRFAARSRLHGSVFIGHTWRWLWPQVDRVGVDWGIGICEEVVDGVYLVVKLAELVPLLYLLNILQWSANSWQEGTRTHSNDLPKLDQAGQLSPLRPSAPQRTSLLIRGTIYGTERDLVGLEYCL